jgi:DNA-binding MurR/RpiR family transcriptional regulator
MEVAERIDGTRERLTPAERRLAEAVLDAPEEVAFGTVAELARRADTSGASVVRFANTLGYDGFSGLQQSIQHDLGRRLRPATARIRTPASTHLLDEALETATANVQRTLGAIDRGQFQKAVRVISDPRRRVAVMVAEASTGLGRQLATELAMLRADVDHIEGSEVRVQRLMAGLARGDVVIALDVGRYDRWLLDALDTARGRGATLIALSDAPASPTARLASIHFLVRADGVGPFDSYVGALALLDTLVAAVADELRATATRRLDRIEEAWEHGGSLVDDE